MEEWKNPHSYSKGMEKQLLVNLEKLMNEAMPYTDPGITRKSLATLLGTNENYLYFALREAFPGETFNDYINRYRLDYAAKLLLEFPQARIEHISLDSGFRSRQTFYRLFKERFQIAPQEYRERFVKDKG